MEKGEKLELSAVVQGGQTKAQGGWRMLPSKIWEIFPKMSDVFREMSVFFEEMSDIFGEMFFHDEKKTHCMMKENGFHDEKDALYDGAQQGRMGHHGRCKKSLEPFRRKVRDKR